METGNIIIRLIADMKQFSSNIDKAEGKLVKFGNSAMTMGERVDRGIKRAQTAVIGLGVAVAAYGVKSAYDYVEQLDKLRTQAGASAEEVDRLKKAILQQSVATNTSTSDLTAAYLQVEKAGIRGARATNLVTAAAQAANITGAKTADVASQIVAAQTLQITKGMSYAQVSDLIVRANQAHVGSLNTLFGVMTGKVGAALAANHVSLAEAAAISNVAAKAGITQARSMVTLATSLTKVENPTKSYAKSLAQVGINANVLASDARKPGGIINVLQDLETHSKATGVSMQTLLTQVFGSGGVGLATVLANNLGAVAKTTKQLSGASGADLAKQFGISQQQLGAKMKQLKTDLQVVMTGIGLALLPTADKVASWAVGVAKYFDKHPLIGRIAGDAAIGAFAAALIAKLAKGITSVIRVFQGTTQTGLLADIARNTAIMAGEGGKGGGGNWLSWVGGLARNVGKFVASDVVGGLAIAASGSKLVYDTIKSNAANLYNVPGSTIFRSGTSATTTPQRHLRVTATVRGAAPMAGPAGP
jgi:TP901 family phage tail tape measure protein